MGLIAVDVLVPSLLYIFRSSHIPTVLRTSSLSLLADCESTYSLALLNYVQELSEGVIDLLQVEQSLPRPTTQSKAPDLDAAPSVSNSNAPPLRRSAVHFLTVLIQDAIRHTYTTSSPTPLISPATVRRAKITLSYLAMTDEDSVVRIMCREAGENLEELQKAMYDLSS
jgi:hypothetical protein